MSDVAKTPREELECKKKYLYEHSMFWECNDGWKCQIVEDDVADLLNEQQSRIKELEKENDDLRTTITKQVEAITEMKDIIYMFQGLRIEDYSSEIEENMVKLQKAYDGNLEDFLNYFKDGCFDE